MDLEIQTFISPTTKFILVRSEDFCSAYESSSNLYRDFKMRQLVPTTKEIVNGLYENLFAGMK